MTSACHCLTHNNGKCRRHHFPLLCVKQCNADVSTFHCVSLHIETHFVPDPHIEHVETDSVWRVIEGKWSFGSGIRIRYPDHHQNLMEWSLGSWLPSHYISFQSVHNFLSNPANRQTNKQTNRQTDKRGWIHNIRPTTLANVNMVVWHSLPGRYTIFRYLADYVNTLSPIWYTLEYNTNPSCSSHIYTRKVLLPHIKHYHRDSIYFSLCN